MFKKAGCYVRNCLYDVKRVLFSDKRHFFIALGAFLVGFLIALGKDYGDTDNAVNYFYSIIRDGETAPLIQVVRIVLWTFVIYAGILLCSVHYIAFIAIGYGGIVLGSFLIFYNAFKAIAVDALCGTLYLIFFLVPVVAVTLILTVCALRSVYALLNYSCKRKLLTNLACHGKSIRQAVLPYFVINLVFSVSYWVLTYVVLVIVV